MFLNQLRWTFIRIFFCFATLHIHVDAIDRNNSFPSYFYIEFVVYVYMIILRRINVSTKRCLAFDKLFSFQKMIEHCVKLKRLLYMYVCVCVEEKMIFSPRWEGVWMSMKVWNVVYWMLCKEYTAHKSWRNTKSTQWKHLSFAVMKCEIVDGVMFLSIWYGIVCPNKFSWHFSRFRFHFLHYLWTIQHFFFLSFFFFSSVFCTCWPGFSRFKTNAQLRCNFSWATDTHNVCERGLFIYF